MKKKRLTLNQLKVTSFTTTFKPEIAGLYGGVVVVKSVAPLQSCGATFCGQLATCGLCVEPTLPVCEEEL